MCYRHLWPFGLSREASRKATLWVNNKCKHAWLADQQQLLVVDGQWFELQQRGPQQWQRQQQQRELRVLRLRPT